MTANAMLRRLNVTSFRSAASTLARLKSRSSSIRMLHSSNNNLLATTFHNNKVMFSTAVNNNNLLQPNNYHQNQSFSFSFNSPTTSLLLPTTMRNNSNHNVMPNNSLLTTAVRNLSTSRPVRAGDVDPPGEGIVKKFKRMFKDYWYVMIPVHCFTSCFWFGGFYLMCKSGIDVGSLMAYFGASQEYVDKLKDSEYVNLALAYACYKIATPARYTVTIGGTTWTIKYLSDQGYLRTSRQVSENVREKWEEEWEKAWKRFAKKNGGSKHNN